MNVIVLFKTQSARLECYMYRFSVFDLCCSPTGPIQTAQ